MNFIFISPYFPYIYYQFCERLLKNGVNVLGIGDAPYQQLPQECRTAMREYYKVDTLEDYDQVMRAVAFFTFRYGKIDWLESNNEYWLENDAQPQSAQQHTKAGDRQCTVLRDHRSRLHAVYCD